MARRVHPLTLDLLERLEEQGCPARQCLTWALDPVHRARAGKEPDERAAAKDAWVSELLREWGSCGRVLVVDQVPLAVVVYAPPALAPGAGAVPTAPASPDAVLVTDIWVHPRHRGRGLGRVLVQATARDLVTRGGLRAVEAFAAGGPGFRTVAAVANPHRPKSPETSGPAGPTPALFIILAAAVITLASFGLGNLRKHARGLSRPRPPAKGVECRPRTAYAPTQRRASKRLRGGKWGQSP